MTGISNAYGNLYAGMYNNPYSSTMNDDFMAQQAFGALNQQASSSQPAFTGYQQPTTDSFEKQGSSALPTALALGTLAGGGVAAGTYFKGANPFKDGKIDPSLIDAMDKVSTKNAKVEKFAELYKQQALPKLQELDIKNLEQYDAVKKLASVSKIDDLPENTRKLLPESIKKPQDAKAAVELLEPELAKIDKAKLEKQAENLVNKNSLADNTAKLNKLKEIEAKINNLPKDASKADIKKFYIDNAKTFNLKGTEVEIAEKAEKLANIHGSKEKIQAIYKDRIDTRSKKINSINLNLEDQFKSQWDDSAKALKKDAPEELTKALKSFKWNKTLKYGGIAAAGGLLLGYLFGGNK